MKSPRELILQQHQSAESKLTRIRAEDLAAVAQAGARPPLRRSFGAVVQQFWREAIRPWRRVWAGLAGVWLVILGLNLTAGGTAGTVAEAGTQSDARILTAVREQRRLLAQLLGPEAPPAAIPAALPGRRSEERSAILFG